MCQAVYGDGSHLGTHTGPAASSRWLIDTFGPDLMASGTGLLDVAGGMGELSFELVNINKLPSTVMDPRPLNLKGSLRKLRVGVQLGIRH